MSARADLGRLEASGLIQIAALQPELEYLFRHALVQEAAYASLLKQDRRSLHRAAAEAIIALHPDREHELAGVIAMHLEQAGENARASRYMILAANHALERFANKEAIAFFVRAGELAGESDVDMRLQSAIGCAKAGWGYSGPEIELERLGRALERAAEADQRLVAEAYFWIAFIRRQRGETPETSPALRDALDRGAEIGQSLGDPAAAALPRALIGALTAFSGSLREGAHEMREALGAMGDGADPVSVGMISDFLAMAYSRLGDFSSAEEVIAHAETAGVRGDAISRIDVDIARSGLDLERGDTAKASAQARECSEKAEGLGAYACVVAANAMLGAASLARDDAQAARAPLERGSELSMVTNLGALRTITLGMLGSTLARLGDMPGGIAGWTAALASALKMGDRFGEAHTLWGRGRTYARQEDWDTALPDLDRAAQLFEAMDAKPSLARVLHNRAMAMRALGRDGDADRDERRSAEIARELGLKDLP